MKSCASNAALVHATFILANSVYSEKEKPRVWTW